MKHVFLVNSHTTFLSSIGTKNYLNIKDEDVVLLFARGYTNSIFPLPYTIVNIDDIYLSAKEAFTSLNLYKRQYYIDKVDGIIKKYVKDDFYLYVPNFWNPVVRLLYTSKHCRRISFVQEGAQIHSTAYENHRSVKNYIRDILSIVRYLKQPRVWLRASYYRRDFLYKQDKMYTYGLDDNIFASIDGEHHIIKWPIPAIELNYEKDASFFILDGLVKNHMCETDILLKNTEKLVEENSSTFNYLKFHPNQAKEEVQKMISFFVKRNLKYEIMDQSVPFEIILVSMHNLKVVGMASSLCFFAKQLGHKVVCHDDWLYDESELFRKHLNRTGIRLYKDIYK